MKIKYMTTIAAMGLTLAIGRHCMAGPNLAAVTPTPVPMREAPAADVPTGYVWDGSEYVGQVGGKYYYLGPHNSWVELDKSRQHRFEEWQKKNPDWRSRATIWARVILQPYPTHRLRNTRIHIKAIARPRSSDEMV